MDFVEYHVDNARQFWAELEDIVHIPSNASLNRIDSALRTFTTFCSTYHEKYLSTPDQLEHAISLLLDSDIFAFHSDRSTEHLTSAAHTETNPHALLVIYSIFLQYGRRNPAFFGASASIPSQAGSTSRVGVGLDALTPMVPQGKRSAGHKRWQGLVPLLMDHVRWSVDDDSALGVPIEARLRLVCVCLMYEVCRVQKLDINELKVFDDGFIEHLFETIEDTSVSADETLNYYLIKLIVALNEQFMVASLVPHKSSKAASDSGKSPQAQTFHQAHQRAPSADRPPNRVLEILMRRLYSSQTFGANIIFMLNRAENTPEDLCMQLLLLKMLYLLFTTPGTHEYFYTNDLRVLVDVFIRELGNLPEESESLRHTYLRVLHPLLTNTQLKTNPYKRPELRQTLLSLISHAHIRDVNPTTRRLVERCLNAEWCRSLGPVDLPQPQPAQPPRANSLDVHKSLSAKASTLDLLQAQVPVYRSASAEPVLRSLDKLRVGERHLPPNASTSSLADVAVADSTSGTKRTAPVPPMRRTMAPTPPLSPSKSSTYSSASDTASNGERRKPPVPPARRKPPPVPVSVSVRKVEVRPGGTTITTIASSARGV
ncbi:Protein LDB17 [Rhizoctonia solani]|uniref:Protein LDB17 n=1 Tax=Rhizoctonia solani TaxID=456999 RepID=A0A0K6G6I8_9AGAM|nr:Protein LDB17 [Rhizoctonia solani]